MFRKFLVHPLTHGLDIDDPRTTQLRRRVIREKKFLRRIYQEWYTSIVSALPLGKEPVLELGSGAGFLNEYIPGLITSEIFECSGTSATLNGTELPFADGTFRAIVMTDVLHHLAQPRRFFTESARCVRVDGTLIMIEPWHTTWSRLVYSRFHHEPFHPQATTWEFPSSGPLSGANGALPWILFERDRRQFEQEFPTWRIETIKPFMPLRYVLSGGVSMRSLMPDWTFIFWRRLENVLEPWMNNLAMFAQIVLKRTRV